MFTGIRNAIAPSFKVIGSGALYGFGLAIGFAGAKGIGNLLTKGADAVTQKVEQTKAKRTVKVEVQPSAAA